MVLSSKTERYSCTIDFIEEQDGKDFIVDAEARLSALRPLYQSGQQPTFNIYIDLNTNKIIRNQKNQVLKESRQRIIEEEARKLQLKQFIEQEEYWLAQRQELERKHKQFEEMQRRQWEEERLRQIEEQLLMNNCLAVCQINRKLYKISELYYNGKPDTTVYSPFLFPQMRLRLPLIPPTIPRPNFESTIPHPNPFILRRLSLSP